MSDRQSRFNELMNQLRAGSQDAAWDLIDLYGPHILAVVRRNLHQRMRSKFDSVDFVQAVWASFFREREQLDRIHSPEVLIRWLVTMARNKVVDEYRQRLVYQKHNVRHEINLSIPQDDPANADPHNATPSQIAVAKETWGQMLESLPDDQRRIVTLRFQGATYREISDTVGVHERTARRVIEQLTERPTVERLLRGQCA